SSSRLTPCSSMKTIFRTRDACTSHSCHSCSNTWKTACSLMDSSRLCKFDPWLFSVLPTNCRPFPAKLACHKPNGWQSSNYVRWLAMILDNRIWKRVHHETYADTPYDAVPGHRTDGSVF